MLQRKTSFSFAVDSFLLDCQSRRLTRKTVLFYANNLKRLTNYMASRKVETLESLTAKDLRQFMVSLEQQKFSAQYQHNIARTTRVFLNFCVADGILEQSPFNKMQMPRMPTHEVESFTHEEVKAIIKACDNDRDRAIVYFLLDSGVRLSELTNLNVADVNLVTGVISIKAGKGQKDRTVHIGVKTRRQVQRYVLQRALLLPMSGALFVGLRAPHDALTESGLVQFMVRLREQTKIPHLTCHTFRRTFAINCLRNGMNVYALAKLMGHEDIKVLERYLKFLEHDIADAHQSYGVVDHMQP